MNLETAVASCVVTIIFTMKVQAVCSPQINNNSEGSPPPPPPPPNLF